MHLRVKCLRSSETKMILKVEIKRINDVTILEEQKAHSQWLSFKAFPLLLQAGGTRKLITSEFKNSHCNFKKEHSTLINLYELCTTLNAELNLKSTMTGIPHGHI